MKLDRIAVLISILLISTNSFGQADASKNLPIPVRITDWGKRSMFVADDFWDNSKKEVIKQIGQDEFEKMLKNFDSESIPEQMSIFGKGQLKDRSEVYRRLSQLKVYQIATFNHFYNGKSRGDYAIIRCPYAENETWDTSVKWDTVYFLVEVSVVEVIK